MGALILCVGVSGRGWVKVCFGWVGVDGLCYGWVGVIDFE